MTIDRRGFLSLAAASALAGTVASPALAQSGKPLVLVVGYAPGGLTDLMARLFAAEFSKALNRQVVIENRPGANGNLATTYAAGSTPNGDTLLFASGSQIVLNPNVYPSLKVKPVEEMAHLGLVGQGDFLVTVPTAIGVSTMKELITLAKDKPGTLNYGTSGVGGFSHVLNELVKQKAGVNIRPVHYRGSALLLPELLANQIQVAIEGPTLVRENIAAGTLKGLMIIGAERSKLVPDVPTAAEVGLDGLDGISNWWGVHGPKGMPAETVASYQAALQTAIGSADYVAKLAANGISLVKLSQPDFIKKVGAEYELFRSVTKAANIVAE